MSDKHQNCTICERRRSKEYNDTAECTMRQYIADRGKGQVIAFVEQFVIGITIDFH